METIDSASTTSMEDFKSIRKDRHSVISTENLVRYDTNDVEGTGRPAVVVDMEEIALKTLHIDDNPTLNSWAFRMFFLG